MSRIRCRYWRNPAATRWVLMKGRALVPFLLYASWVNNDDYYELVMKTYQQVIDEIEKEAEAMGKMLPYKCMKCAFLG